MKRLLQRCALGVAAMSLFAAPVAAQNAPLEINAILSLTGSGAFIGKSEQQSLQVLEKMTNVSGGIKGRPIKFVVVDDGTNPAVALQLATGIAAKGGQIIVGPGLTATCSSVLPILVKGPFDYCLAPGVHPSSGSFMFSANTGTADLIATELRFARGRGWTRVALMLTTDASGQDIGSQIDGALALPENKSIRIVARQVFGPTDISVGAQMQNIKSGDPQVLIAGTSGTPFGTLLRGAHDAGLDVPIISLSSNMHTEQMSEYGSILPKQIFFVSSRGAVQEPQADAKVKAAQQAFFEAFKRANIVVSNGHTVPWDAVNIIIYALRHIGPNATAEQLRAYVANLKSYDGIDGPYDFHAVPQRGIGDRGSIMYAWDPSQKDFVIASKPRGDR
jgi:branched-chain amino acid transport system substrate-binding protein